MNYINKSRGSVISEYLILLTFTIITLLGAFESFKEILAPAFKRMTAFVRWPIP